MTTRTSSRKNWTHVRKLMGYVRYDSAAALAAMNAVYADLRLLHNLFLPSVKLQRKERHGARLRRYYDAPQTPLDRVRACPQAKAAVVAVLLRQRDQLDPFALAARVDQQLARLYTLANHTRAVPATTEGARRHRPRTPVPPRLLKCSKRLALRYLLWRDEAPFGNTYLWLDTPVLGLCSRPTSPWTSRSFPFMGRGPGSMR